MSKLLKIGLSACFFHHDETRPIYKGKRLMYIEESMAHYVSAEGALPLMIPTEYRLSVDEMVDEIDGLLLQGGSDVSPKSYDEEPIKPEWGGDWHRDQYEIRLINECIKQKKPVLGICRGLQILNVALGGTLYQDINHQVENTIVHRDWHQYDRLHHDVNFSEGSLLEELYQISSGTIISIHHQAIKDLGKGLVVEATSSEDQIIEAIRHVDEENFIYAVQWHPEFQQEEDYHLISNIPLMRHFLDKARARKLARA